MLGKLIKYDLLADWKRYAVLFAATLLVSTTSKMIQQVPHSEFFAVLYDILGAVLMALLLAMGVLVIGFSLIRFYKNVLRDEAYLTHTLPVHTWQIIVSKLISTYIWSLAALLIGGISMGIIEGDLFWIFGAVGEFSEFVDSFPDPALKSLFIQFAVTLAAGAVISLFCFMSHIYFCFALGNFSSGHKTGVSVLAFFAVTIAENIIGQAVMRLSGITDIEWTDELLPPAEAFGTMNVSMTVWLIISFVISLGFFIAAERIFAKKLNLE
ncbi:MAG: hypothetical protein NC395_05960 [Prevotella sp.]|nr:hypothetical protein [Prevotella sp.]